MTSNQKLQFDLLADDKTKAAFQSAGHNFDNLADKGEKSGSKFGGALEGVKGTLGKLGGVAAGAGTAIAAGLAVATVAAMGLGKALQAANERTQAAQKAAAQLGPNPELYKTIGKIAGKVYGDGFTESIQDASIAVRDVIRNKLLPKDATDGAIADLTKRLSTVATLFEDSTEHVATSVSQMLRTGLVKDAGEALDILTAGLQQGGDKAQDLLDTFNEYGTQFRKFGLDAQTAMGLLVQGLGAGARDADVVADAIKEFSIRAVDGSKATADGFKALGLDAKAMATEIGKGGTSASAGLDTVLDKLREIKDPVKRAQVAVQLFGTQAEDLGAALFALDPSEAVKDLGDLEGASKNAGDAMSNNLGSQVDSIKRKFEMGLANIGDKIAPFVSEYIDTFADFGRSIKDIFKDSPIGQKFMGALKELADKYLKALREGLEKIVEKVKENKEGLEQFAKFISDVVIPVFGFLVEKGLDFAVEAVKKLIGFVALLGEGWKHFKLDVFPVIVDFVGMVMDAFGTILHGAALAFGWMPGIGPKLKAAEGDFENFKNEVNAKLSQIKSDWDIEFHPKLTGLNSFQQSLNKIADMVRNSGINAGLGARASGGPVTKGQPYIVGERRPEIFVPDSNGTILPDTNMLGGGSPNIIIELHGEFSDRALVKRISAHVRGAYSGNVQAALGGR